jgi:histone acetyltransferase MYST1
MIKYWKGTHLIHADPKTVQEHLAKIPVQASIEVDPTCLHWQPLPSAAPRKRP